MGATETTLFTAVHLFSGREKVQCVPLPAEQLVGGLGRARHPVLAPPVPAELQRLAGVPPAAAPGLHRLRPDTPAVLVYGVPGEPAHLLEHSVPDQHGAAQQAVQQVIPEF